MDVCGFLPQGVGPGGGCSSGITGQCVDNAACDGAKCQCNSDYYADSGQCHQRKYESDSYTANSSEQVP